MFGIIVGIDGKRYFYGDVYDSDQKDLNMELYEGLESVNRGQCRPRKSLRMIKKFIKNAEKEISENVFEDQGYLDEAKICIDTVNRERKEGVPEAKLVRYMCCDCQSKELTTINCGAEFSCEFGGLVFFGDILEQYDRYGKNMNTERAPTLSTKEPVMLVLAKRPPRLEAALGLARTAAFPSITARVSTDQIWQLGVRSGIFEESESSLGNSTSENGMSLMQLSGELKAESTFDISDSSEDKKGCINFETLSVGLNEASYEDCNCCVPGKTKAAKASSKKTTAKGGAGKKQ